jgi:hypothetical protein
VDNWVYQRPNGEWGIRYRIDKEKYGQKRHSYKNQSFPHQDAYGKTYFLVGAGGKLVRIYTDQLEAFKNGYVPDNVYLIYAKIRNGASDDELLSSGIHPIDLLAAKKFLQLELVEAMRKDPALVCNHLQMKILSMIRPGDIEKLSPEKKIDLLKEIGKIQPMLNKGVVPEKDIREALIEKYKNYNSVVSTNNNNIKEVTQ